MVPRSVRHVLLSCAIVLLALVPAVGLPGLAAAQVGGSATVSVCGPVTVYTAANALVPGAITVGGVPFVIAAGTNLVGAGTLGVGSNVCLQATLNASGQISAGTVSANASTALSVCGTVTAYTAATGTVPGSVTIGGQRYPIAAGTTLTNSALLTASANPNVCINGTLNGLGQISSGGVTAAASGSTTVNVCGTVSAYSPASSTGTGSVTINGQTLPIAVGASLAGSNLLTAGANVCLSGTANAAGQLQNGTVTANGSTSVYVCGTVTAYNAATASAPGSITVGGQRFGIAAGTTLSGDSLLSASAPNVCLQATLNAAGQISSGGVTANAAATTSFSVCGTVTAYTAATTSSPGSITIAGQTYRIAANTALNGAGLLTASVPNVCINGTLNAAGQISNGTVTANAAATTTISICGTVSAYTAATASAPGSVTIAGQQIPVAAGAALNGSGLLTTGANVCLNGTANAAGQLQNGTVTANANATVSVCGVVSAYTAATSTVPGSITIAGQTFPIAAGTTLNGAANLVAGTNACLQAVLNASGQISSGGVTVNASAGVNVCGVVTAYTAATSSAPGSITIAGITFPIAAGTTFAGSTAVAVGANLCLNLVIGGGGTIQGGTGSPNPGGGSSVSGGVTSYTPPTATTSGSITIGGTTFSIAPGTTLNVQTPGALAAHIVFNRVSRVYTDPSLNWVP